MARHCRRTAGAAGAVVVVALSLARCRDGGYQGGSCQVRSYRRVACIHPLSVPVGAGRLTSHAPPWTKVDDSSLVLDPPGGRTTAGTVRRAGTSGALQLSLYVDDKCVSKNDVSVSKGILSSWS